MEAQISKEPIWMRNTPASQTNYKIQLWSSKKEEPKNSVQPNAIPKSVPVLKTGPTSSDSDPIADELKQIEDQWKTKFKMSTSDSDQKISKRENKTEILHEASTLHESSLVNKTAQTEKLDEMSEVLAKKFIDSIDIHKRPTELTILKQVFEFGAKNSTLTDLSPNEKRLEFFEIDEKSFKRLIFIEYIAQRISDLLSKKTRIFLIEKELDELAKLNQERERVEYLKKCDHYIMKNNILFGNLTSDSDMSSFRLKPKAANAQDDNGEAEMLAKLEGFMSKEEPQKAHNHKEEDDDEHNDIKQPLPNYKQLKEEALKNELRVSEFFRGITKKEKYENELEEIDQASDTHSYNQNLIFKVKNSNEEIARILPTVDNQSQSEIRRSIFFEKLIK